MISVSEAIELLRQAMTEEDICAQHGLGEELFLFASTLMPVVNVDLLVYNDDGQFLLSRRNDPHSGIGWHVPGGCVRFKESIGHRIREVARQELGITEMVVVNAPLGLLEFLINEGRNIAHQDERSHFITIVYKCHVGRDFIIDNHGLSDNDVGFVKWFTKLPEDMLEIQRKYGRIIR